MGSRIDTVVFDLHGVLLGCEPQFGGGLTPSEVVKRVRHSGFKVAFVSNSSSLSRERMVEVLAEEGIGAQVDETVSAGVATGIYLRDSFRRFRLVLIGQPAFRDIIVSTCGARITGDVHEETVVVGRDPKLSPGQLRQAAEAGKRGALLIATSLDRNFRLRNQLLPGPAETVRRVEEAMGISAKVIGKPNTFILEKVLGMNRDTLKRTLLVGDSVECDVQCGVAAGALTALLAKQRPRSGPQPHYLIQRLDQVLSVLEAHG